MSPGLFKMKVQNALKKYTDRGMHTMGMMNIPAFIDLEDGGKFWVYIFDDYKVKTYVPREETISDIVNYGYITPYLLVFMEEDMDMMDCIRFAKERGFADVASKYYGSVVFVYPTSENGWTDASPSIYTDIIANTKNQQYYTHGVIKSRNRFTKEWGEFYIRGAIFRAHLYGYGKSADYIGKYCMKTIEGEYLWGPGEITPASITLHDMSVAPDMERNDIPVVSVDNSDEINDAFKSFCKHVTFINSPHSLAEDFTYAEECLRWCGTLCESIIPERLHMIQETGYETVHTSPDNAGDYEGTAEHDIGYVVWYNESLKGKDKVPALVAFHGGGDSAMYIAHQSGWINIANRHDFLLIAIENHTHHSATEIIELLDKLKAKYPIDPDRFYASGFSMGGCKCWDMYQEYPKYFKALAPMDATFDVGENSFGKPVDGQINREVAVPVFYAAGEKTPLPELPYQEPKCTNRIKYLFEVNKVKAPYTYTFEDQSAWDDKLWGIAGESVEKYRDESRDAVLTVNSFVSEDGVVKTVLASISGQGHECREHTCEYAWRFMDEQR